MYRRAIDSGFHPASIEDYMSDGTFGNRLAEVQLVERRQQVARMLRVLQRSRQHGDDPSYDSAEDELPKAVRPNPPSRFGGGSLSEAQSWFSEVQTYLELTDSKGKLSQHKRILYAVSLLHGNIRRWWDQSRKAKKTFPWVLAQIPGMGS